MVPELILAIAAVIAVIYGSYAVSKYIAVGASKVNGARYMKVIDRIPVGQDRSILILQIGDKRYLVGNTQHSIELLRELGEEDLIDLKKENFRQLPERESFRQVLDTWMKKKG